MARSKHGLGRDPKQNARVYLYRPRHHLTSLIQLVSASVIFISIITLMSPSNLPFLRAS